MEYTDKQWIELKKWIKPEILFPEYYRHSDLEGIILMMRESKYKRFINRINNNTIEL